MSAPVNRLQIHVQTVSYELVYLIAFFLTFSLNLCGVKPICHTESEVDEWLEQQLLRVVHVLATVLGLSAV